MLLATEPAVRQFTRSTFDLDTTLLEPSVLPSLAIGVLLTLVIGSLVPIYSALRYDPLEILEAGN